MIPGMKKLLYTERLRRLGLWSLETRRYRADLIEVYKMIHGLSGARFDCFFDFDNSGRTRGHSFKLKKKRFNTQLRQHFFTERVINLWNSLDDSIVSATTINSFKNELHRLWTRDEFPMGLL